MSKIQELLKEKNDQIDFSSIYKKYPWVIKKGQNCIISPDSDGFLCALFMSKYLNWNIKGFYDGKVMVVSNDTDPKNCVFLDMEIYRKGIKSCGQHMLQYSSNKVPENWTNFDDCIQPNNLRSYDKLHDFRLKYPLATIHFLMAIVSNKIDVKVKPPAFCPLFFTDGTFNVLFKYPENVLNWLTYLRASEKNNPLKDVFENEEYTVFTLMNAMDDFFKARDEISVRNERGDRLRISEKNGRPFNLKKMGSSFTLEKEAKSRAEKFITLLSKLTEWNYLPQKWTWENYNMYQFQKLDFKGQKINLNQENYDKVLAEEPISWAITSGQNMEYSKDKSGLFSD